ncbi:MAG: efflux RND transporter periplasmic adaptor subunit [Gemmatimonadota bacterium]|nr:efflux RND transporter periplasmic adaptor subunit [Gemmatimonadota bacterium]
MNERKMAGAPATSIGVPAAVLLAVAVAMSAAACGTSEGKAPEGPVTPAVEAVQARFGALPLRERLTGTVRAAGQVAIFAEASGPIVEVMARNGDRVQAGDPLVRIRAETSRGQYQQAEAGLASARAARDRAEATLQDLERRFERSERLVEDNFISQEEFETLRTELAAARATLAQAEAEVQRAEGARQASRESLRQTVVRAPIDGTVGRRNAEVGMYVTGSTPLFTIGRLDRMQIDVPVTQEMLARIRPGQTAEIRSESLPDTVLVAEVSRISPFIQPGSFSAEIEIDIENPDGLLLPGMFVTVDVLYGESEQATLLPKSAIYEDPRTGVTGVWVAGSIGLEVPLEMPEGPTDEPPPMTPPTPAEFHPVEVLASGRHVVGVEGIEPGAWVVVVGQHLLSGQVAGAGPGGVASGGPAGAAGAGPDGQPAEGTPQARVRPIAWERLLELQGLQREDLLRQFMEKQQRIARQVREGS